MRVAAVVVRWRGGDEVDRCLRSLVEQSGRRLSRVVLVDSGSGDGGAERLTSAFPRIEVLALPENRSFAHAANAGVGRCPEELILLLNPDTEVKDSAVDLLADELENRPETAGVVPQLVDPDGSSQHRWQLRRLPTAPRLALGLPGSPVFSAPPATVSSVPQPAAAAWLVRRDVWRALDGFDERYAPAWWEDVDFCARLDRGLGEPEFPAEEGFLVAPAAQVVHEGGSSVSELSDRDFLALYHRNLMLFSSRHHRSKNRIIRHALKWSLRCRAVLRPKRRESYLNAAETVAGSVGG